VSRRKPAQRDLRRPALAWYGGLLTGLRRARDSFDLHLRGTPPASATWRARVDQWFGVVGDAINAHWDEFATLAACDGHDAHALRLKGLPEFELDPDTEVPTMRWPDAPRDDVPWVALTIAAKPAFTVRAPFRPIELAQLPPGSVFVPIDDPLHAAAATAAECWRMLVDDVAAALADVGDEVGWARVRALADHYRAAVRLVLASVPRDQFRDWTARLPPVRRLRADAVPELITRIASGAAAQRVVGVHLAQALLRGLIAEIESENAGARYRKGRLVAALALLVEAAATELLRHNATKLARQPASKKGIDVRVILRPVPTGLPVLALVPRRARAAVLAHPGRRNTP
jgi:hypothetical protein